MFVKSHENVSIPFDTVILLLETDLQKLSKREKMFTTKSELTEMPSNKEKVNWSTSSQQHITQPLKINDKDCHNMGKMLRTVLNEKAEYKLYVHYDCSDIF